MCVITSVLRTLSRIFYPGFLITCRHYYKPIHDTAGLKYPAKEGKRPILPKHYLRRFYRTFGKLFASKLLQNLCPLFLLGFFLNT